MKANEWLLANGHIKAITRGRMSRENIAILTAAWDNGNGVKFSDFPKGKVTVQLEATEDAPAQVEYKRDANAGTGYSADGTPVEIAPYRYTEDEFHAVQADGTNRSLREVCQHCGVSLVQCYCGSPSIVAMDGKGHVSVSILPGGSKPRTGNIWDSPRK